ncbi:cytochrome P450, partial [Sarocladium strictum]
QYGPTTPVRINLFVHCLTLLKNPVDVATLLKRSKDANGDHWLVQVMINAFGADPADTDVYLADDVALGLKPSRDDRRERHSHVILTVHKIVQQGLSGERLKTMERALIRNVSFQMNAVDVVTDDWTTMPRVLSPSAYKIREKMKKHIQAWHSFAHANYDVDQCVGDASDWEEFFGSRMMRKRAQFFRTVPLRQDSIAADDLALIWGGTANAIPAIGWMILEVLQRPGLIERVRKIIDPLVQWDSTQNPDLTTVNVEELCNDPLLQSMFAETMRFHNGTVVNRKPGSYNLKVGGWNLRKDEPVIMSTYHSGRNAAFWNEGTPDDPHPVSEFWAERFIVDPKNIHSGPVRPRFLVKGDQLERSSPYFSTEGTDGLWIPFGGGPRMCPGRHFAKRQIIVTTALFLATLDVELSKPSRVIENDMKFLLFGVMHPKGVIPGRIRRRTAQAHRGGGCAIAGCS